VFIKKIKGGKMNNDKEIKEEIKKHEGYRETVYMDSVGIPTGGYGHAFLDGSKLPALVCEMLFEQDYNIAKQDYEFLANREGLDLDPVRRGVLINMLFNMGINRVSKFKKMMAALSNKAWGLAADEMLDSKWARQVGKRATYLAERMRNGK
jgi:lysozyme